MILAEVPLMKQMLSISAKMVAAARLFVLCRNNSTMGIPVEVARIVAGSVRQKRSTRMKNSPLRNISRASVLAWETYVTPPMTIANIMARGASRDGLGISSVRCRTTSNPISDRAD